LIRITGGYLRGRALKTPPTEITRPALSSVRQAVFNILAPHLPDARFLDLFGGTGAYAIESVSRGAERAVIVDLSRKASAVIRQNLQTLGVEDKVELIIGDALAMVPSFASRGISFDIIAVAPPHFHGLVEQTMKKIDNDSGIVAPGGVVFVQHHHDEAVPDGLANLTRGRVYKYGITLVTLFHGS